MPTTYTSRVRAAKLETGSSFNTWGTELNAQDFDIFDEAFGVVSIALTGVDITLTTANASTDQARNMGYRFTGTGGVIVTMPSVQAVKAVVNNSSGSVTIRATVSSSVAIAPGSSAVIATNGTDTWQVASNLDAEAVSQVFSATSATSNTIAGSGPTITFTLNEFYRAFSPGMNIRAAVSANPAIYIDGYVTSYTGSGTTLVMQPTASAGSGTYSAWTISFAQAQIGLPSLTGNAGEYLRVNSTATATEWAAPLPSSAGNAGKYLFTDGSAESWQYVKATRSARTSNTILAASDNGNYVDITSGTFTQTITAAATLGNGWWCYLGNSGTGEITIDPNGSETIDGLTSYVIYPGEVRLLFCTGAAFFTIVVKPFYYAFTSSGTFVKPPGYLNFEGLLWAGGGSGGKGANNAGGAGGACLPFRLPASALSATNAYVQGAGGAAQTAANTSGNNGGNSTFAGLTAYGGGGGGADAISPTISGGGGGVFGAGGTGGTTAGAAGPPTIGTNTNNVYGGGSSGGSSIYGGGSGAPSSGGPAGETLWGGAGGGSVAGPTGGTSIFGGSGGLGSSTTPGGGNAPAGGGGGTDTAAASGAGGRGELRIWGVA